ncbi:hypothetical protein JKJ11_00975 [Vibrio sp. SCSIO 43133]|uniref:hypothetical protein n=1 Tax=Vibrio sp. SCSIO 43133 TaxID=2802577 RepID=UPI0020763138|nr:hypothetical protein [Vibrio sp. SCSIO 43133]USE00694.1 hypothetical protein JKJ11_00975 [Vibrio sp. SCSIO 43133]
MESQKQQALEPQSVRKIIERWDARGDKPDLQLTTQHAQLIFAWRAFQKGEANKQQQLIVKEIYRYLMTSRIPKKQPRYVRNIRVDGMVVRHGMSVNEASAYIANMDGEKVNTVERAYSDWKSEGAEANELDRRRFLKEHKRLFFQEIEW